MKRWALLLMLVAFPAAAQSNHYAGRPLVDVIAELQQRGLTIVYSTDLVKPSMRVGAEPRATNDRALLDEILAPHALGTKSGAGGVISIVRATQKETVIVSSSPGHPLSVPAPTALASIVVTASNYSVLSGQPEHRDFLTRQELNRTAHLGDDLFRALAQLPGAASTDFSAAFRIRGGDPQETLVLLDGLEVADPFHIKYFQNAISIVDSDAIGSLDYLSGGFPVEYGNAMSGVIDMSTTSPQQRRHTYAGISFSHARLVTDGTFAGDRGEYLLSARRGYFDVILGLFYSDVAIRPHYGDIIGKVQYRLSDRSVAAADVLIATDRLRYAHNADTIRAEDDSIYGWLNLRTAWTPQLFSQSVLSLSHLRQQKDGALDTVEEVGDATDHRAFDIAGFRQDWTLDRPGVRQFAKFGVDAKHFSTRYDYRSHARTLNPFLRLISGIAAERSHDVSIRPNGTAVALYAADRIRIARPLAVEAGVRYERESWMSGDAAFSPRVNVVFAPAEHTAIRASWGMFRQAQRLDAIAVEDGEAAPYAAQRSRQTELAFEHHFGTRFTARAAIYRKEMTRVRPRYESLFDRDEFFPELKYDRILVAPDSSSARGIEVLIKDDSSHAFTWWVSAARSRVRDRFGSTEVPRSWDQPNAVSANLNYRRAVWNANLTALIHTGWPTTRVSATYLGNKLTPVLGQRNAERLAPYRRYDARVTRSAAFSHGMFRSWIELTNVLNHQNPCCIGGFTFDVDPARQTVSVSPHESGIGWLPSFGIAWEF